MSLKVGRVSGIEIRLHFSWFLIFVLVAWSLAVGYLPNGYPGQNVIFYWSIGVIAAATLFISVLLHEIAHSLVAQRYKISVTSITLYFLGGVSETAEEAHTPDAELRMAAAGPLTSVLIGVIFYFLWQLGGNWLPVGAIAVFQYSSYINLLLAAFNLIPAFPMDGGRILRAFVWGRKKDILPATRIVTNISRIISFGFIALGFLDTLLYAGLDGLWLLLIGLFISNSATASMNETRVSHALAGVTVGDIMSKDVKTVEPDLSIQQVIDYAFKSYKHNGFPVVKNGELVGIITEEDIRKIPTERLDEKRVDDVMKPAKFLLTAKPGDNALDALIRMSKGNIGRLPVLDGDKLVGIITRGDFARTIQDKMKFRS